MELTEYLKAVNYDFGELRYGAGILGNQYGDGWKDMWFNDWVIKPSIIHEIYFYVKYLKGDKIARLEHKWKARLSNNIYRVLS